MDRSPRHTAENILQIDEFRSVIEDVTASGKLDATARTLINNLLSAGATEIIKVMTPRSSTVFLDAELEPSEMLARFRQARHSRVPVYRKHRDNLVGFLHAEDMLRLQLDGADLSKLSVEDLIRPPIVVPLTKTVNEMFDFFVKNNASAAAAALNEFGGVAGSITINDVMHFIFGSLSQKVETESNVTQVGPNAFEMPGDTKLAELNRVTHLSVHDPRMTTIAGVAFRHLDRLPKVGDQVTVEGVTSLF